MKTQDVDALLTLQELAKKNDSAYQEFLQAKKELWALIDEAKAEAGAKIEAFYLKGELGQAAQALADASIKANLAYHTEKMRQAEAGINVPYPLGTVLKIDIPGDYYRKGGEPETLYGVVELVTKDTVFPKSGIQPEAGTFIIRYLGKNKKPTKKFTFAFNNWKPVDTNIPVYTPEPLKV